MVRLKNDLDFNYLKEKTTNHQRKVDQNLIDEVKLNLETEVPQQTKYKRFELLLEKIPNLSVATSTI